MTTADREKIIVASLLEAHTNPLLSSRPGPATCTALAYAPDYWESVEASKLAEAVGKCIRLDRPTTKYNVQGFLEEDFYHWVDHPLFSSKNALPLSVAETEAMSLIPVYKNKRIIRIVADHYQKMLDHPEGAREYALSLKIQLGDWL